VNTCCLASSRASGDCWFRWNAARGPDAVRYNPDHDTIDIGGHDFAKRKKYRDVLRNLKVAFVADDLASVTPWRVRGIEMHFLSLGGRLRV
jgi:hypothetical protein